MAKIVRTDSSGTPTTILEQGIVDATLSPNSENAVQNKAIYNALAEKADADGLNADLIAGGVSANNVSVGTNNAPYNYRAIPSVSGAKYTKSDVVGGSIVWNQLVQNGDFDNLSTIYTASNYGTLTVSNNELTYTVVVIAGNPINNMIYDTNTISKANHKYFVNVNIYPQFANSIVLMIGRTTKYTKTPSPNVWNNVSTVINGEDGGAFGFAHATNTGYSVGDTIKYKRFYVIDLTLAFGSTIADYVYSLEQSTAGSGIAWLKSYGFLHKDYYDYNSGELQSVCVSSRVVVGFNQWDEEWELGDINNSGEPTTDYYRIRSKNYIPCLPSTSYYFKDGTSIARRLFYYDANKNFISYEIDPYNKTFETPSNCHFLKFRTADDITTYNNTICINLSDTLKNGTYEPYRKHTYPLDHTKELHGIPKLDSNNQLYYDGDTYEPNGTVTRKYGIVDLGTLDWVYSSGGFFISNNLSPKAATWWGITQMPNVISSCYEKDLWNNIDEDVHDQRMSAYDGTVRVSDSRFNHDATAFKTAMDGVQLVYELATPNTETADPFTDAQTYEPNGTEEFVDYPESQSTRDVTIPCGHTTTYYGAGGEIEIPTPPSSDGNYYLSCKVASGTVTYSWEVMSS